MLPGTIEGQGFRPVPLRAVLTPAAPTPESAPRRVFPGMRVPDGAPGRDRRPCRQAGSRRQGRDRPPKRADVSDHGAACGGWIRFRFTD